MRVRHGLDAVLGAAAVAALVLSLAPAVEAAASGAGSERVIVELTGEPALAHAAGLRSADPSMRTAATQRAQQRLAELRTQHAQFRDAVERAGIAAHVTADLTQLVDAVALAVPADQIAALRSLPDVAAVYPDAQLHASDDEDVTITGAPQVWQSSDPSGKPNRGSGETVAVVDTGIDYTHPDLGGGFGAGYKVVGGYDFVNGDDDPMDDNGHGTHVAGIVAADPAGPGGRTGEAPGASLTAYKVLAASGYGDEATIIEGIEAAVAVDNAHRADVINLSLGGDPQADDPLEQACERAVAAGTVVVAAAGNSGPGESTVGSPAEAPDVLAVGASITGVQLPTVTVTSPVQRTLQVQRLGLSANPPPGGETLDVVDAGNGLPDSYDGIDASGKAVLAAYNSYELPDIVAAAEQHGAAALLLYTPNYYSSAGRQPGPLPDFVAGLPDDPDKLDVVAAVLNGTDATDLRQWLADGPVAVRIGGNDATDLLASFSSHGPALGSYALKPDLVAPGVEIGSTWPGGTYRDDSGTSMAAPHVAGAAALLREAHPAWSAAQVAAALTGGSTLLDGYTGAEVGAGRLDVARADRLGLLAQPRIANLGLADQSSGAATGSGTVTLTNMSAQPETVQLAAEQAPGSAGLVDISPHAARLAPGGQLKVTISVRDQQSSAADLTGWLVATPNTGPALTVPYLLAVRPLELHVTPDPAVGATTLYLHAEPTLGSAPIVTVSPPSGEPVTETATFDHAGWWRAILPAGPAGTYQVSATARSQLGPVLAGRTAYQQAQPRTGQWQSVGPDNEGAYEMAATSQRGRMYALPSLSAHAGVFRTDDSGATWHELHTLPIADGIAMGVAADPADPDTVYLAVQGGGADATYQGKIFVSHDAGESWTTLPYPDVAMHDLSLDASGRVLTVPAFNGDVYVSLDRGQTWTAYPSPDGYPQQARVIGHDLFIAAGSSLYAVRDIDTTPSAPVKILTAPIWYQSMMDVVGDTNVLLARTFEDVFVSYDNGATWQTLFTPPDDDPFVSSMQILHGDIYVAGSNDIWVDRGEGTTWTSLPTPVPSDEFTVSIFDPTGTGLVVSGAYTGLFATSDDGASYQRVGLAGAQVAALAVTQDETGRADLLAGTSQGPFETPLPDSGAATAATRDWGITDSETGIGDRFLSLAADPHDPQTVYAVRANAFSRVDIQKSTDGGASWDELEGTRISTRAYQVVDDPADPDYVYVTVNDPLSPGVLVSRDGGQTWRKNNLPVLVTAVAADPANPDRILLGGPSGLYLSTDEGQTITQLSSSPVSAIAIDPNDASHVLVGGAGLFVSRDGGHTLRRTDRMPYRLRITAIAITSDGTAYAADGAGTDSAGLPVGGRGVLTSPNGGDSWTSLSAGLANLDVESLAVAPDGGSLFVGTGGGSVYRLER